MQSAQDLVGPGELAPAKGDIHVAGRALEGVGVEDAVRRGQRHTHDLAHPWWTTTEGWRGHWPHCDAAVRTVRHTSSSRHHECPKGRARQTSLADAWSMAAIIVSVTVTKARWIGACRRCTRRCYDMGIDQEVTAAEHTGATGKPAVCSVHAVRSRRAESRVAAADPPVAVVSPLL